jgi:hypothetical protein
MSHTPIAATEITEKTVNSASPTAAMIGTAAW